MAITKIHPIKSTLKKAIDYIVDPTKTDDKLLVSSFGCAVETADLEFEKTRLLAMQKGNNLAHHLIQAFEPGEVSYSLRLPSARGSYRQRESCRAALKCAPRSGGRQGQWIPAAGRCAARQWAFPRR